MYNQQCLLIAFYLYDASAGHEEEAVEVNMSLSLPNML